jgi:MFS superfamily sulfate permease-like transporter
LGGKIPRNTKIKVIRHWLDGLTRERIAKKEDIATGSVTGIINEAREEEEYNDIDLLREVAVRLKEEGTGLPSLAFAIRLKRIMEENDINEDQIEPIIQDFATYSLRNKITYDTIIKIGREALYLEQKYGVPIEKIPEYITQGKETIDRLEYERLAILRQTQRAREDRDAVRQKCDAFVAELEKYRKEIPSIQRIMELENELEEAKKKNELHEISERVLRKERDDAQREALRSSVDVTKIDARWKDAASRLNCCLNEQRRLRKIIENKSIIK